MYDLYTTMRSKPLRYLLTTFPYGNIRDPSFSPFFFLPCQPAENSNGKEQIAEKRGGKKENVESFMEGGGGARSRRSFSRRTGRVAAQHEVEVKDGR